MRAPKSPGDGNRFASVLKVGGAFWRAAAEGFQAAHLELCYLVCNHLLWRAPLACNVGSGLGLCVFQSCSARTAVSRAHWKFVAVSTKADAVTIGRRESNISQGLRHGAPRAQGEVPRGRAATACVGRPCGERHSQPGC